MASLCFGSFGTFIWLHSKGNSQEEIVSALVGTIDPDNRYKDDNSTSNRLLNCTRDFASGVSKNANHKKPKSNILSLAKTVDKCSVIEKFKSEVLPLLDEDKMEDVILSILYVIENDPKIDSTPQGLQQYFGVKSNTNVDTTSAFLEIRRIILPDFLAYTLIYIVNKTSNKTEENKVFVTSIKNTGNNYTDTIISSTNELRNWNSDTKTLEFFNITSNNYDENSKKYFKPVRGEVKIVVKYDPTNLTNWRRVLTAKKRCKTFEEFFDAEVAYIENDEGRIFSFDKESIEHGLKKLIDI